MKPIIFLPEAEQEMLEAAAYYEVQADGLGGDYLSEVQRTIHAILSAPEAWPVITGHIRRRLIRRFPCGVLYRIDPDEIVIVAVAHLRKKPGYWRSRVSK